MKKVFNLSVILAVLMAAFSFTSCSDDDDDDAASVSVKVETAVTSAIVTINCEENLKSVELWQNNSKLKNIDLSTLSNKGKKGVNVVTITDLNNGETYSVKVTSETGATEKQFTVGQNSSDDNDGDIKYDLDEVEVSAGMTIYYKHGTQKGQFEVVSADEDKVVLKNVLGNELELSDAGASYLSVAGQPIKLDVAKESGEILVAKVSKKAIIAGGNSDKLSTKFATNATKLGK